jgi:hypothetical protein
MYERHKIDEAVVVTRVGEPVQAVVVILAEVDGSIVGAERRIDERRNIRAVGQAVARSRACVIRVVVGKRVPAVHSSGQSEIAI